MNFYKRIHLHNKNYNQTIEHFYHLKKLPHIPPVPPAAAAPAAAKSLQSPVPPGSEQLLLCLLLL